MAIPRLPAFGIKEGASKLEKVNSSITMFNNTYTLFRQVNGWYSEKFKYTATLRDDAYIYNDIMEYIDKQTSTRKFKILSDRSGVSRIYNADNAAHFYIDGHKIRVSIYKPPGSESDDPASAFVISTRQALHFTCGSLDALIALENLMEDFTQKKKNGERPSYIGIPTSYGDWDYSTLRKKKLESVFLPPGVKEDLVYDIQTFLDSEELFLSTGLPWHRGYCFYGEPGNGKSSIALALANHFSLDVHNLPLSMVKDDKTLSKCVADIRDKSILLLEDIDVYSKSMSREQEKETPTLAGLLNTLDGVSTPHGLITIMTTNYFEKLDPALVRPGRVDYRLEVKEPVDYQIESMYRQVFGDDLGVEPKKFESMAAVAEVFKRNLSDPEQVRVELKA